MPRDIDPEEARDMVSVMLVQDFEKRNPAELGKVSAVKNTIRRVLVWFLKYERCLYPGQEEGCHELTRYVFRLDANLDRIELDSKKKNIMNISL